MDGCRRPEKQVLTSQQGNRPPLRGSDRANTTAGCVKEAVNKEKKHKVQEKIQNSPGLAHKRHFRSAGENRSQMLLPKPKKEMFTTWCTLCTKLVPAVRPRGFFWDDVEAENSTMVESASEHELKATGSPEKTNSDQRACRFPGVLLLAAPPQKQPDPFPFS